MTQQSRNQSQVIDMMYRLLYDTYDVGDYFLAKFSITLKFKAKANPLRPNKLLEYKYMLI